MSCARLPRSFRPLCISAFLPVIQSALAIGELKPRSENNTSTLIKSTLSPFPWENPSAPSMPTLCRRATWCVTSKAQKRWRSQQDPENLYLVRKIWGSEWYYYSFISVNRKGWSYILSLLWDQLSLNFSSFSFCGFKGIDMLLSCRELDTSLICLLICQEMVSLA